MPDLLIDPSFGFSEDGLEWLESNRESHGGLAGIVVSAWFMEWLEASESFDLGDAVSEIVAPDDRDFFVDRRDRLRVALQGVRTFSYETEVATLSGDAADVIAGIRATGHPLAQLWSDEWAFLQTNSFMVAKLKGVLNACRDAGATIIEVGKRKGEEIVFRVLPSDKVPSKLTPELVAKVGAKWIVVGLARYGGKTGGAALGAATGLPPLALVGAILGAKAGKGVGLRFVVAIDP